MIRLPRRSVTRFFIPLIDVLTLLFCTFLLLPMLKATSQGAGTDRAVASEDELHRLKRELERRIRETPQALQQEIEELRQQKIQVLQERLAIRLLEINEHGRLIYRDAIHPEGVPLATETDAQNLIDEDRLRLGSGKRDLYYLILCPPSPNSPYPTRADRLRYERWFKDVAHGYDLSRTDLVQGGKP
jgi:hypothetical protein